MVKTYAQLYLDARRAIMASEDPQTAGTMARYLLCHASGKSQEEIIAQRDMYASEETLRNLESMVQRYLNGEPLAESAYSYSEATGEFATAPGALEVPAATFTQSEDGVISATPGVTTVTVTGTI